jgi:hypothetical protein
MYTGIRVAGKLKPDWVDEIKSMLQVEMASWKSNGGSGLPDNQNNFWNISGHPVLKSFGDNVGRASFIPFGALSYMPVDWESEADKAFYNREIDSVGVWRFQCALKNYAREIDQWMSEVVPVIFETCEIEYYYEEWTWSSLYELRSGRVVEVSDEHVKYGYDDSDHYGWGGY